MYVKLLLVIVTNLSDISTHPSNIHGQSTCPFSDITLSGVNEVSVIAKVSLLSI